MRCSARTIALISLSLSPQLRDG